MEEMLRSDFDVYCWLKKSLAPRYQVVADPQSGYYSESLFRYLVLDNNHTIAQLSGDYRTIRPGSLMKEARDIVESLVGDHRSGANFALSREIQDLAMPSGGDAMRGVIASRLPPQHSDWTYFCSGRSAFAYLLRDIVQPKRVWLPAFVCWSLISTMQRQFPETDLQFYEVRRNLECCYPDAAEPGDAIVVIHYFGKYNGPPSVADGVCVLEDISHVLLPTRPFFGDYVFGSLRKTFRVADGGHLRGFWNPVYEPQTTQDAWLRHKACDWRDLREAENMMDRYCPMADMSSQSVAVMAQYDVSQAADQRRQNEAFLSRRFPAGTALQHFDADEIPLLHNRLLPTPQDRDSLRTHLAGCGIFCSIHWPAHPRLHSLKAASDARWLEHHILSIPVSEDYGEADMDRICRMAERWQQS